MKRFISGDRVKLINKVARTGLNVGDTGTVIYHDYDRCCGVEWDNLTYGHTCGSAMYLLKKDQVEYLLWIAKTGRLEVKEHHGWNVYSGRLTKIKEVKRNAHKERQVDSQD